ncbi:MAG: hypothetical protein LW630_00675 [Saprospiraceae bacterium]|nr:hypothetical protein [Saprospiraceae bacterium]
MSINITSFFQKHDLIKKLLLFLVTIYLFPKNIWKSPGIGLDPSWELSLNLALKHHLVWGKDIVFTYGPLGYLSTFIPVYASSFLIGLYTLFVTFMAVFFLRYVYNAASQKNELIFITVFLFFHGHFLFLRDSVSLYFYTLFFLLHYLRHQKQFSLVIALLCCIVAFFMKVNTGIILLFIFFAFILYGYLRSMLSLKAVLIFLFSFISIVFTLSQLLNVDLIGYVANSLPIIDAYNDAMGTFPGKILLFYAAVIILLTIVPFIVNVKKLISSGNEIFLFLNVSLLLYVVWKQSFVRYDGDLHTNLFFICSPFIILSTLLFSNVSEVKNYLYTVFFVSCMISLAAFSGPHLKYIKGNVQIINLFRKPPPTTNPSPDSLKIAAQKKGRWLPDRMLREIGNKSVDLLGYETSFIYYNNLKYNPRPIIQSYSAYTPELIRLNTAKYSSETAPDYVLYHIGTLDERHPFWDESPIYQALFERYAIIDTFTTKKMGIHAFHHHKKERNQIFLFKKQQAPKKAVKHIILDTLIQLDGNINIPKTNQILYMEMDYEHSLLGKAVRMLFQPAHVSMELHYADGDSTECRLILPVMKAGVPINKKVLKPRDAYSFFQTKGFENTSATSFSIHGNPLFIKNSFRIRFIELNIPD